LRALCSQSVAADALSARLRALPFGPEYRAVAREHRAVTQTILSLAVKLRITPSSNRLSIRSELSAAPAIRPWEVRADPDERAN
jgi:hypothetical protein